MRFIDIVLGCVLLGLIVVLLQLARPDTARAGEQPTNVVSERITWLWAPAMRRAGSLP
jgi:hypothetical protein